MVSASNEKFGIPRTSVTGSMLSKYQDKDVRLIGQVVKTSPLDFFDINTGDGSVVTIKMAEPLDEPVEGLVDVQGRVFNRNTIKATSYIVLPSDQAATFDLQMYSEAVAFTANFENPWTATDT